MATEKNAENDSGADLARAIAAALDLCQVGRADRAEQIARRILSQTPGHAEALLLRGAVASAQGRPGEAVALFAQVTARSPEAVSARVDLGCALLALGRLDAAAGAFREAVALWPDFAVAHCNLASALTRQGAHEAALESASCAAALQPEMVEAHLNRAAALSNLHRFEEAEAAFRSVLTLRPDLADPLSDLGQLLIELKRYDEAVACHRQAAAMAPDNPAILTRLTGALAYVGDPQESEQVSRHAVAVAPNAASGWSGLGHILRALGRFDEARAAFEQALALDRQLPDAYAGLAIIGHDVGIDEAFAQLGALLQRADCPDETRIDADFALGMLLDNAGRYDEAFAYFNEANVLARRRLADAHALYDHAEMRRRVDTLIATCTPELFAAVAGEGNPSELPVFIVGMPRSGTSLVEQIAASHSRVFGAGELGAIAEITDMLQAHAQQSGEEVDPGLAGRLAEEYIAHLRRLGGDAARVIDKMPDNILSLGLIGVLFPNARIIFCRRDLRDVCLSCFQQKFDQTIAYATDLIECAARGLEIERLAEHWRQVLPQPTLTIDYEKLVADLEGESRRLIAFLGLDWEPGCLEFYKTERPVRTASGWQVRQPLFTHSVGRWRRYERHLQPLLEVLAQAPSRSRSA